MKAKSVRMTPARVLATRSIKELLALDWGQSNAFVGARLGLRPLIVTVLRRRLRDQGLRIPRARSARPGWDHVRQKYVAAGIGKRPDREVAEALGVSRQAVHYIRRAMGCPLPPSQAGAEARAARSAALRARYLAAGIDHLPNDRVARALGLRPNTVARMRRVLGVPSWKELRVIEREKEARSLAPRIRALARKGCQRPAIARELGIACRSMYSQGLTRGKARPTALSALVDDVFREVGVPRNAVQRFVARRSRKALAALDWSQGNRALARLLGLQRNHVGELRRLLHDEGYPVPLTCPRYHMRRAVTAGTVLRSRPLKALLALDWGQGNYVLGPVLGLTPEQVSGLRRELRRRGHTIPALKAGRSPRGSRAPASRRAHPSPAE